MAKTSNKKISLALQGGGAHGAFTWGILDRLLQEPSLDIAGLSGTSAGAMNATMVAYGLMQGGKEGAREQLSKFWNAIADFGAKSPLQPTPIDDMAHPGEMTYSPFYHWLKMITHVASPQQFNPANVNPLRNILVDLVDFEKLRKCKETKLYLCATNVRTIRAKVFTLEEMSVDVCLASACLPQLFHAVEIDGEAYWDGGFIGNPPLFPLIEGTGTQDILLCKINPIIRKDVPQTPDDIEDRLNEISFNSSLMWEMRMIEYKNHFVRQGYTDGGKLKEVFIHSVSADEALEHLGYSSKLNTTRTFLSTLHTIGYEYGEQWLRDNWDKVGTCSTCNVHESFL